MSAKLIDFCTIFWRSDVCNLINLIWISNGWKQFDKLFKSFNAWAMKTTTPGQNWMISLHDNVIYIKNCIVFQRNHSKNYTFIALL